MGGNALSVFTRRYNKDEYVLLQEEVRSNLLYVYSSVLTIPSYNSKDTFGDLDLIVPKPKYNRLDEYLKYKFNTKQVIHNNQYVSFEYKEFQVDLIHINKEDLALARTYFSYNDLGMLMGILAKRLGCKYGFNGLYYTYFNEDRSYKKDILLTKDIHTIFNFLDLSYSRFIKGFDKLVDVFDYVISSKYFDSKVFINEEEWNHIKRTRNRKRSNWNKFIQYLLEEVLDSKDLNNIKGIKQDKYYVANYFPYINLIDIINELDQQQLITRVVKSKFNGNIVREITGLKDKELGNFIARYKLSKDNFQEYIIQNNIDNIKKDISTYFTNDQY